MADEVWLKNGHQITGKILDLNRQHLVLEVPEGKMTLKRHLIDYVVKTPAQESLLSECERRLRGGFPGSALPYLRKEYTRQPDFPALRELYRECLVAEIDQLLQSESTEDALRLWSEVRSLPGEHPSVSELRQRVLKEQGRLLQMEQDVLDAIQDGTPVEVLRKLKILTSRFPAESRSWKKVHEEQSLRAAYQYLENSEYLLLQKVLSELLRKSPKLWKNCRSALAIAWIENPRFSLDETLTWLPESPALHLALAEQSSESADPLSMGPHLKRVTDLVGAEINSAEIRQNLHRRATEELLGTSPGKEDLSAIASEWMRFFWDRFAFPGPVPETPVIVEHDSLTALNEYLGSTGDSARIESVGNYGQIQRVMIHVVADDPFLSQDELPRELFRLLIDTALATPRCPLWLQEGLAARARGTVAQSRDRQILQEALAEDRLPNIEDLLQMTVITSEVHRAACGAIVESLLETTPRALLSMRLQKIRDHGLEAFLRSGSELDTLHKLQQRWIGEIQNRRG